MSNLDQIVVRQLHVPTLIGVYPAEREQLQTLRCDLVLWVDVAQAAQTDNLQYTIDYAAVAARVRAIGEATSYQLLEALGEHIAKALFAEFDLIEALEVTLFKDGCIPHAQGSELTLKRHR